MTNKISNFHLENLYPNSYKAAPTSLNIFEPAAFLFYTYSVVPNHECSLESQGELKETTNNEISALDMRFCFLDSGCAPGQQQFFKCLQGILMCSQ